MPFTLDVLENTDENTNLKRKILKLIITQKKQTTQKTAKQNYPGSVDFYDTRPGNEMGLFYNAPPAHTGLIQKQPNVQCKPINK